MTAFWPFFAVIVPLSGPMTALGQQPGSGPKEDRSEATEGVVKRGVWPGGMVALRRRNFGSPGQKVG